MLLLSGGGLGLLFDILQMSDFGSQDNLLRHPLLLSVGAFQKLYQLLHLILQPINLLISRLGLPGVTRFLLLQTKRLSHLQVQLML